MAKQSDLLTLEHAASGHLKAVVMIDEAILATQGAGAGADVPGLDDDLRTLHEVRDRVNARLKRLCGADEPSPFSSPALAD